MYVTRPLSMYKRNPGALSDPPPAGPYSGYLVISDEEPQICTCFGLCKDNYQIFHLPFPQNKNLTIRIDEEALFVPVLNQPLSSNRYYVISRSGWDQGYARTSSKEEDMITGSCCSLATYVKPPRPLDPSDDYQQFEIIERCGFHAKSVAPDGIPPGLLRNKRCGWTVTAQTPRNYHLGEALGSNDSLRAKLPDFNFPLSNDRSESVVVGKWYCPFMFVKEGRMRLNEQMMKSVFYELTLEQRWEKIFSEENNGDSGENHAVFIDVDVETEVAKVAASETVWDDKKVVWFNSFGDVASETLVGLRLEVVDGMKWEQKRVGWKAGNKRKVRVERVKEFEGINRWRKFGCYVLVESFVLKRMDGRVVLAYDFRHTHQIRCKWE